MNTRYTYNAFPRVEKLVESYHGFEIAREGGGVNSWLLFFARPLFYFRCPGRSTRNYLIFVCDVIVALHL